MKLVYVKIIGTIAFIVAIVAMVYINTTLNRQVDRLTPKAKKYAEICGAVKAALLTDRSMIHDTDNPAWLTPQQIEDERRHLYDRVGNARGGDDSKVMLDRCMPQPFPMDAWRACTDDACLRMILKQAMDSIP